MSKCIVKGESLTALANTIRDKLGASELLVFPEEFIDAINVIGDAGGEDTLGAQFIEGIENYVNDKIITVAKYGFTGLSILNVTLPHCSSVDDYGFYDSGVITVNLPECISIGMRAFLNSNITTIDLPECISIGDYGFNHAYNLSNINIPKCNNIGSYGLYYCYSLTSIDLPKCTSIGERAFSFCSSLTSISLPMCTSIGEGAFGSCNKLSEIYLNSNTMCVLENPNAFETTPYAGYTEQISGTPCIYVPANLLESYKVAENWSQFSEYFRAIE